VDRALKGDAKSTEIRRESLREIARLANISVEAPDRNPEGRMKPCPKCGSEQTSVFRWILEEDGQTLTAAEPALARRGAKTRRQEKS
jgi:hypothetical protein